MNWLSGDQNILNAPSVPGSASAWSVSSDRIHRRRPVVKASKRPSGDSLKYSMLDFSGGGIWKRTLRGSGGGASRKWKKASALSASVATAATRHASRVGDGGGATAGENARPPNTHPACTCRAVFRRVLRCLSQPRCGL